MRERRLDQIVRLRLEGLLLREISEQLGIRIGSVSRHLRIAKERGLLRALDPGERLMADIGLPEEVCKWVRQSTPAGARPGDLLRAIIIDAYHEEMECHEN